MKRSGDTLGWSYVELEIHFAGAAFLATQKRRFPKKKSTV
jgi:hypothetical protein